MRGSLWLILAASITVVFSLPWGEGREVACEIRTFDYLALLGMIASDDEESSTLLQQLERYQGGDPLRREKWDFLNAKLGLLGRMVPLVERQIQLGGATYGCQEDGYKLLMGLGVPSFATMSRREELEWLWKKVEKSQEVTAFKVFQVVFPPLLMSLAALAVLWALADELQRKTNG